MTGYEEFQQIMAEINRKKKTVESEFGLPPEFAELFNMFKRND
jgi:hypothetical protein